MIYLVVLHIVQWRHTVVIDLHVSDVAEVSERTVRDHGHIVAVQGPVGR